MGVWAQQPWHIQMVTLTFSLNIMIILSHKLSWSQPSSVKFSPLFWSGISPPEGLISGLYSSHLGPFLQKCQPIRGVLKIWIMEQEKIKVSSPTLPEGYLVCSRQFFSCLCDCPEAERFCEELSLLQYNRSFYTLTFWHNICMNKREKSYVFLAQQRWYAQCDFLYLDVEDKEKPGIKFGLLKTIRQNSLCLFFSHLKSSSSFHGSFSFKLTFNKYMQMQKYNLKNVSFNHRFYVSDNMIIHCTFSMYYIHIYYKLGILKSRK